MYQTVFGSYTDRRRDPGQPHYSNHEITYQSYGRLRLGCRLPWRAEGWFEMSEPTTGGSIRGCERRTTRGISDKRTHDAAEGSAAFTDRRPPTSEGR